MVKLSLKDSVVKAYSEWTQGEHYSATFDVFWRVWAEQYVAKVKVVCPQCNGAKLIEELSYLDQAKVVVKCQSCKGKGYILDELPD